MSSRFTSSSLSRRTFLRGLSTGAGVALLAPFMRQAYAAQACFDSGAMPRRFVIVMQGNGLPGSNLLSDAARSALSGGASNAEQVTVLNDLAGASSNAMRALKGAASELDLTPQSVAIHGLSSKITGGSHTAEFKALSCSKERSETFDAWLARTLHTTQPFDAIRLGVTENKGSKLQYRICISEDGKDLPIVANPVDGHTTLFGSIAAGAGGAQFATQRELLDFAHEDITAALTSFSGSSQERKKLETYLSALEELRTQQDRLSGVSVCLKDLAMNNGFDPDTGAALSHDHPLVRLEEQFRLGTAALLGNLTNVVMITNSVGYTFSHTKYTSLTSIFAEDSDFSGTVPWRHGVCHGDVASASVCKKVLDRVIEVQVEQIAKMARTLASVPEGNGTMLDHTAIVFLSDNGDTHHSEAGNWPMLLVGGSALGLKTGGRTLLYPKHGKEKNPRVSNMFNTLGYAAGSPLDTWGGEPDRVERGGPLSELLA